MVEAQTVRVEELTIESVATRPSVGHIADHRKLDRRQMHTDLMGAPRIEFEFEESLAPEHLDYLEVGACLSRAGPPDRHLGPVAQRTSDRRFDSPTAGCRPAVDKRPVPPHRLPVLDLGLEGGMRPIAARDDHQATGPPVKPVHDSTALMFRSPRQQITKLVDQGRPGK